MEVQAPDRSLMWHLTPHDDMATALRTAPAGARLVLGAGRHVLHSQVVRRGDLTVEAGEPDVLWELDGRLAFEGPGTWVLRGLALAVVGPVAGLVACDGTLEIVDCRLTGREGARTALRLQGEVVARLEDTTLAGFAAAGLAAAGRSRVDAIDCRFHENGGPGLRFSEQAGGSLRNNMMERNGAAGVHLEGQAAPELEGNICFENAGPGLHYSEFAAGGAYGNLLEGNRRQGALLDGHSAPTLEENTMRRNVGGIRYAEHAGGRCFKNACDGNLGHDISLAPGVEPWLLGNQAVIEREGAARAVRRAM